MDFNSNNFEAGTNFRRTTDERSFPGIKKSIIENWKKLSLAAVLCLIFFPLIFISIGTIYRNSCVLKEDLPVFLVIFGLLILINLAMYMIIGTTFLALIRRARSFSLDKGVGILIATLVAIIFGIIIFVWWIIGTIWWIKVTLNLAPKLHRPYSFNSCDPIIYWTALVANIFGLIGFILQICIAIGSTSHKQLTKNRGG